MFRTLRPAVFSITVLLAIVAVPCAAHAASYLDEAVQGLQSDNIYVSPLATQIDTATEQQLQAQAAADNIGIAVLPAEAANETGGDSTQFLAQLARGTGYDTIVVVFGNDVQAASSVLSTGEAGQIANQAEADSDSVGGALLEFVAEVKSAQDDTPVTQSGSSTGNYVQVGGIALLLALLVAGLVSILRRVRRQPTQQKLPKLTSDGKLRASLETMRTLAGQITNDPDLRASALTASGRTDELMIEINRLLPDRMQEMTGKYARDVDNVNKLLGTYVKAQNKPYSIPDVEGVIRDTRRGILAYSQKVHRGYIQASESEMMEFEVALSMLTVPSITPNRDK